MPSQQPGVVDTVQQEEATLLHSGHTVDWLLLLFDDPDPGAFVLLLLPPVVPLLDILVAEVPLFELLLSETPPVGGTLGDELGRRD